MYSDLVVLVQYQTHKLKFRNCELVITPGPSIASSGSSGTFSLGGQWGPWFLVGGIQSEQLQVSYYELYYASL